MAILRDRLSISTKLARIAELAKEHKEQRFLSIAHLLTVELLYRAFGSLRKEAAAGIDGVSYAQYEGEVWGHLARLHERLRVRRYRAQPLRRTYIPKEDGRQRPIAIGCLEDKVVQKAVVKLLNLVYEQDFLRCSYGFRPGRSAHDALNEVGRIICQCPIGYVFEADICSYFDAIVREKLMEMIGRRIGDGSILRLISKWMNVGVIEENRLLVTKTGVGQGQVISPLLANVYLHYVLDEWFEREVKGALKGQAHEIRYADDFILCFQYREDAEKVMTLLRERFATYGLTLHPEKTRLIEFGRRALEKAGKPGGNKPSTFNFLGFTHICKRSQRGRFTIHVRTMHTRLRRSLKVVSVWCQQHRHDEVAKQRQALNAKLRGHYQYYGRPTNFPSLWRYYLAVRKLWRKWLNRRTRGKTLPWTDYEQLLLRHPLLRPFIAHSWAGGGESSLRNRVR